MSRSMGRNCPSRSEAVPTRWRWHERWGADGLRWWLLRDVPRSGDADFREPQLARRANELADGIGNLVNRTIDAGLSPPAEGDRGR